MSFTVDLGDFEDFSRRMKQAPQIVREELTIGVNRMALAGQAKAQSLVGVDTGTLRRSLTVSKASAAGLIPIITQSCLR